ncbi:dethiobiotin synthase [Thalassotalea marina]|uniref:ATP-dependent dethiobiotin synthetase BioD n=1 Tax=Thalassotalea marina TaxID=1673741 RepID=A0A919BJE1_9GAMM|nr:dethiobiotin synthase [Thalassotalea marina]GHF91805.1 ATP-dependent dethiobiotin synthetase BioD [Thalassotalea marina]
MKKIFITATDTDAGKTHIACAIVNKLVNQQNTVLVFKPISAGCEVIGGELVNEDAQRLQQQANGQQSLSQVNPIAYQEPIAPHIAALTLGEAITVKQVTGHFNTLTTLSADVILTEGAGGWRLPLGNGQFLSDFVKDTEQDVVLVVNMKLGCLNHAVLTYQSIISDGLNCIGWVANCQQEMPYLQENIDELKTLLDTQFLGQVGFEPDINKVAELIDISPLLVE